MARITETLDAALMAVPTTTADAAAVDLARRYAALVDAGEDLIKVGPLLLAALTALGMTPRARAAVTGGGAPDGGRSKLDELRARRATRQHPA